MRNHFFLLLIFYFFILLQKEIPALLQGNQVIFVSGKASAAPLSIDCEASEAGGSFSYFLIPLGARDLTRMSYLSFWVRAEGREEAARIEWVVELHEDTNGDGKYILGEDQAARAGISRFTGKAAKEGWRKVLIPLSRFRRIRHWERILEMAFVFENPRRLGKGKLLIDHLLFGSNYPEGLEGREIPMQNRVSSFKIGGRIISPEMKLKRKPTPLTLALTFIDPYLEAIHFEESEKGDGEWHAVESFYDHSNGGVYETRWEPPRQSRQGIWLRAVGINVLGEEAELAGPYHLRFD